MKKFVLLIGLFALLVNLTFAQDDKTVTLVVNGQGETQAEAKQNALRNAIEQAFGTFISSKTEILNDELVEDEIVSVSNGNIQKFEILSEVQTPNGEWSNTVKATVSVSKLTSFCESKGIVLEFKGGLFAINIKQQQLNEQNEVKAIDNMCEVLMEIGDKSFDYEIKANEPRAKEEDGNGADQDQWEIPIEIDIKANINLLNYAEYFCSTLKGISMNKQEADNYIKLGKSVYSVVVAPTSKQNKKCESIACYFRSEESFKKVISLIMYFKNAILGFKVINGVSTIVGYDLWESSNVFGSSYSCSVFDEDVNNVGFNPVFCRSSNYPVSGLFRVPWKPSSETDEFIVSKLELSRKPAARGLINDYLKKEFACICNLNDSVFLEWVDLIVSFENIQLNKRVALFKYIDEVNTDQISMISEYKVSRRTNNAEDILTKKQMLSDVKGLARKYQDCRELQFAGNSETFHDAFQRLIIGNKYLSLPEVFKSDSFEAMKKEVEELIIMYNDYLSK